MKKIYLSGAMFLWGGLYDFMNTHDDLYEYIKNNAINNGALLVGTTKIRKVEPLLIFAFPFTNDWFLHKPYKAVKMFGKKYCVSKHVLDITADTLKSQGYSANYKTIMSLYGDFRPLAVAAGLGEWGRNGLVVNKNHGSALLFAAIFTNAPLKETNYEVQKEKEKHCSNCEQCLNACPANAFEENSFHISRCLPYAIRGCAECLKACTKKTIEF